MEQNKHVMKTAQKPTAVPFTSAEAGAANPSGPFG